MTNAWPTTPPIAGPPTRPGPEQEPEPTRRRRARPGAAAGPMPAPSIKRRTHHLARWLHVYASMIALLIVLFFGITGLTLNHPDWAPGGGTTTETSTGTFPFPAQSNGTIAWLPIAEYVRTTYDVKGTVGSFDATDGQGSIAFENPGYTADLFFDVDTGAYQLTIEQQGFVAVMNDLHKGRNAGSTWRWTIDVAAVLLVAISLTGLTMQFFLRKRRRSALVASAVGAVVLVGLIVLTVR